MSKVLRLISDKYNIINSYLSVMRYIFLRWKFQESGSRGSIEKRVRFKCGQMFIGNRVAFREGVFIGGEGILKIGNNTTINENTYIACTQQVTIGSDCLIAARCYILDVDHEFSNNEVIRPESSRHFSDS